METLTNIGVIIGIITGIFGIGGYIVGITGYFRNKAAAAQRKQTTQPQSVNKQSSYQTATKQLSRLDWMLILYNGVEDLVAAYFKGEGRECIITVSVVIFGSMIIGFISAQFSPTACYIALTIFGILFFTTHILFYTYFVGRRIEQKTDEINKLVM